MVISVALSLYDLIDGKNLFKKKLRLHRLPSPSTAHLVVWSMFHET